MRIIGIFGGQNVDGLTATVMKEILNGAKEADCEFVNLNDYHLVADQPGQVNADLDLLTTKLSAADVWVLASPTYFGTVAGQFKQLFDCLRPRMVRMTKEGDSLPGQFKNKHYVSVTSCFASSLDNTFTHQLMPHLQ